MTKHSIKRQYWTKEQEDFLKENYGKMSNHQIAKLLGRANGGTVQNKAQKMGITKPNETRVAGKNDKPWTKEDDEYLIKIYGKFSAFNISQKMNRSLSSIYHRASRLGLKNPVKKNPSSIYRVAGYKWAKIRKFVQTRDNNKCMVCGYDKHFTVHHIHPVSEGGSHKYDNLITLCPNHHTEADGGEISRQYLKSLIQSS